MTTYYIDIPEDQAARNRITNLLAGLEPVFGLSIERVLKVEIDGKNQEILDPVLKPLAIDVFETNGSEEKAAKTEKPAEKKPVPKKRQIRIYEVIKTGKKYTKAEMDKLIRERHFDAGTRVRHSRMGMMIVVSGLRGHELVPAKNQDEDLLD